MQMRSGHWGVFARGVAALGAICSGVAHAQDDGGAFEGFSAVQQLQIVDCLLPGQVRVVGGRIYPTPRRPTRTTAADCAARGGEFLAYDRADYRSALNVWLPTAEGGDAEAQTLVGEIYERGAGAEPDYEAAAEWYRKAADQGYSRAAYNLGALYEQGLGVPEDRLEALNWYRRSSDLPEDSLIFRSAAATQQAELERQIERKDGEIDSLAQRIEALEGRLREQDEVAAELATLREALVRLEQDRETDQRRLATFRSADGPAATPALGSFKEPEERRYRRRSFGRFYALVIGVEGYANLEDLASPGNDAARAGRILEEKYGFSVRTLVDPDQTEVMRAVNQLNEQLTADDNLLIWFAGHGSRLQGGARETGYWLPANADPPPDNTFWVSNDFVTDHLARLEAKRVLVVADSCYAGLLGDDPGYVMVGESSYSDDYIEWKMPRRSRMVLASGGDRPVLDDDGGGHSVFARALFEELENNEQVLTAPELFLRVRERVRQSELASEVGQDPQLKVIKNAGNEVGDFFFVPG